MFGDSFTIRYGFRPLAGVRQDQVRRYNFPKVKPGDLSFATGYGKTPFGKDTTTFVTNHAAAGAMYGFKNVTQVFPMIELKPKELAMAVGAKSGKLNRTRSFKI